MDFMGKKIKIFEEGTEYISKEDIKKKYDVVILPHSLKHVDDLLFYGYGSLVVYVGKVEEFEKIIEDGTDLGVPSVLCSDGSKMIHI